MLWNELVGGSMYWNTNADTQNLHFGEKLLDTE